MSETAIVDKFVAFRGALRAAVAEGNAIAFVTVHAEGQPTALYRLDVDKAELTAFALPGGATAIVADEAAHYVAGTDGFVHRIPKKAASARASAKAATTVLGSKLDPAPTGLALIGGGRLAVMAGAEIVIVDRASGAAKQRLALPDEGTALAADASGKWLVAGTSRGVVAVFDGEGEGDLVAGESKRLHEGAVSVLAFDPDEPSVYSSGSDDKLLSTHVRGALEPEDRTGGGGHEALPTAIVVGPEDKLYTAGRDAAIKAWTRGTQKRRPSTQKDGVARAVALVRVEHKGKAHLALAGDDNTIRLFAIEPGGKVGARVLTFRDAYALAKNELSQSEPARRKEAMASLAEYNDGPSIELLAARAAEDSDHALKVEAARLLGATKNARAQKHLEGLLGAAEEQVRLAALAGLRALEGEASLRPLELALAKKKRDLGAAAVAALAALAPKDEIAMARLQAALDDDPAEVRVAAVTALEALFDAGKKTPAAEPDLFAVRSNRADVRRLGLTRLLERGLLGDAAVLAALRRCEGDADADVRRTAFLVSVMARPALAEALRARDRDLHRQLAELSGAKQAGDAEPPKAKKAKADLSNDDLRPLFEAMASRQLDTCLLGARGLAALQDERAFGTLLQLTNEKAPAARVEACKALAELGDLRAAQRLRQMLRDAATEVRDAAFSALAKLEEKAPLRAAEAGLLAPAEDARVRGLSLLVRHLKQRGKGSADAIALLERALNDTATSVRSEAFKAALSLEIGGEGAAPLRFGLRSIHADVRREVLGEVMGRIQEEWAPALLLELFADPDAALRGEAFDFADRRSKGKAREPLEAALEGKHSDLKLKAIEALSKKRVDGSRDLLARALRDEDAAVRIAAVSAMFVTEVESAMESAHPDVRVRAAAARAVVGDARALAPLLAQITEKEPEGATDRASWIDRVVRALAGLADLGAGDDARRAAEALVVHKEKAIRDTAARALGWLSRPGGDLRALYAALAQSDKDVKLEAAFGLALVGDPAGIPVLKGLTAAAAPAALRCLSAAVSLGRQADDLLAALLDHAEERVRNRALLVMMLIESSEEDGSPDRCLAALASAHPRVRLTAARALEAFSSDRAAFRAFAAALLNDRGDDKAAWTISNEAAYALAELVTRADPPLKARAVRLLSALDEEKQDAFDRAWEGFEARFGSEIAKLVAEARDRKPARSEYAREELERVVLGAYAGLSRMAGGPLEMRVRQTAIARLTEMAKADAARVDAVRQILLLGLGDPAQPVRKLAFDSLAALGMSAAELGAEALAVGQRDVGALGLALLSGQAAQPGARSTAASEAARKKILEEVLVESTDGLEEEAGKLLAEIVGWESVHVAALAARSQAARERAVAGLAALYEASEGARKALRNALGSRHRAVREKAATELAAKKDAAAFGALVAMLRTEAQPQAIAALARLGDPKTPAALLDRIDDDPAGDAKVDALLEAAGAFRDAASAARLLAHVADKKRRRAAVAALLVVSGYDRPIADPEDDRPRTAAEPARDDEILAKLVDAAYRLGDTDLLAKLVPMARWARSRAVDAVLAPLSTLSKEDLRNTALEAIGFRLRKRGGPAEPLVAALSHASPTTQLFAAEGLALAGRAEGVRVLLTAIDAVPEIDQRRRAVRALGRLGDERALDALLKLVNEDGHALQEAAAEAIGNLKATPKGQAIEELLLRLAKGPGGVALAALAGLRWLDTRAGWTLVRARIQDADVRVRTKAAELLAFDSDPASRAALVDRIENDRMWNAANAAANSLRRWHEPGSIEPDYVFVGAALQNLGGEIIERLRGHGDAARILALLPKIQSGNEAAYLGPLVGALLARDPLPIEAAAASLTSTHDRVIAAAAQILGRAGKAAAATHGQAIVLALRSAADAWKKARADVDHGRLREAALAPTTERYRRLLDAAGKLEVGGLEVAAATTLGGSDPLARDVRIAAISSLALGFAGNVGLDALAAAVRGNDARARSLAAAALRAIAPERAAALVADVVDDRSTIDRLVGARGSSAALREAAAKLHAQGAALPHLAAAGDVAPLAAALRDKKLSEAARLGAAEALGRIATPAALDELAATAASRDEDEELRKAAYRAIRRGRRYAKKREVRA